MYDALCVEICVWSVVYGRLCMEGCMMCVVCGVLFMEGCMMCVVCGVLCVLHITLYCIYVKRKNTVRFWV